MQGNNKIIICSAEMQEAIQHYFRSVLFKPSACPIVKAVRQSSGVDTTFEVDVQEDQKLKY